MDKKIKNAIVLAVLVMMIITGIFVIQKNADIRQKNAEIARIKEIKATDFFEFTSVLQTDKDNYKIGETVLFSFTRTSKDTLDNGKSLKQLILIKSDGSEVKIGGSLKTQEAILEQGFREVQSKYTIPEDTQAGKYKLLMTIQYSYKGVDKTVEAQTNEFNVIE